MPTSVFENILQYFGIKTLSIQKSEKKQHKIKSY